MVSDGRYRKLPPTPDWPHEHPHVGMGEPFEVFHMSIWFDLASINENGDVVVDGDTCFQSHPQTGGALISPGKAAEWLRRIADDLDDVEKKGAAHLN